MLSLSAAACAPLRIKSQNESPGTSWVIIATVARGVFAVPAPIPLPDSWGFPPVLEQDASRVITAAQAAVITATLRGVPRVAAVGRLWSCFMAILVFLCSEGSLGKK